MEKNKEYPVIFVCDCGSNEHQIIMRFDEDDQKVYCSIHLIKYGFWRRVKKAVKYIFGYKSRYGEWDEFILSQSHAAELNNIVKLLGHTEEKVSYEECCSQVARKHGLGFTLITGHKSSYFMEAFELYKKHNALL